MSAVTRSDESLSSIGVSLFGNPYRIWIHNNNNRHDNTHNNISGMNMDTSKNLNAKKPATPPQITMTPNMKGM